MNTSGFESSNSVVKLFHFPTKVTDLRSRVCTIDQWMKDVAVLDGDWDLYHLDDVLASQYQSSDWTLYTTWEIQPIFNKKNRWCLTRLKKWAWRSNIKRKLFWQFFALKSFSLDHLLLCMLEDFSISFWTCWGFPFSLENFLKNLLCALLSPSAALDSKLWFKAIFCAALAMLCEKYYRLGTVYPLGQFFKYLRQRF